MSQALARVVPLRTTQSDQVFGIRLKKFQRAGCFGIIAECQGAAQSAQVGPAFHTGRQKCQFASFKVDLQSQDRLDAGFLAGMHKLH